MRAKNARAESRTLITEGGVKQGVSARRREETQQVGWGLGKIPKWGRRTTTWYTYLRTDRGPIRKWEKRIGEAEGDGCGMCGVQETGWHLVSECPVNEEVRKANINEARRWEDLGDKAMVRRGEWMVESLGRRPHR